MSAEFDVSVCLTFHAENELVIPSLASLTDMVNFARNEGQKVQVLAAADNATQKTTELLARNNDLFDHVHHVSFGQPAEARNYLVERAGGRCVAILDGDDLWSKNWISRSVETLSEPLRVESVLHPEFVYYFFEEDFQFHSATRNPSPLSKSHFVRHRDSTEDDTTKSTILLDNFWSAHSVALRSTFLRHPYLVDDREKGTGIEDWGFNIETLNSGIQHLAVEETLHMVRIKEVGSQNVRNFNDALLPRVPPGCQLSLGKL